MRAQVMHRRYRVLPNRQSKKKRGSSFGTREKFSARA